MATRQHGIDAITREIQSNPSTRLAQVVTALQTVRLRPIVAARVGAADTTPILVDTQILRQVWRDAEGREYRITVNRNTVVEHVSVYEGVFF